jgi:hypothetical protein
MRRHHGIWLVVLLAAALGAAAVGVHGSSAAQSRPSARASTLDATYSCRVSRLHYASLYASATLPPVKGKPQPGVLGLTTGTKSVTKNGTTTTVSQVSISAAKDSLRVDKSSCRRVKQQIPLKSKGIPGPPTTATPTFRGFINEQCPTAARVLVRLHLKLTDATPTHALLAIRNDNAKRHPIAFFNWSPRKVTAYTGTSCLSS